MSIEENIRRLRSFSFFDCFFIERKLCVTHERLLTVLSTVILHRSLCILGHLTIYIIVFVFFWSVYDVYIGENISSPTTPSLFLFLYWRKPHLTVLSTVMKKKIPWNKSWDYCQIDEDKPLCKKNTYKHIHFLIEGNIHDIDEVISFICRKKKKADRKKTRRRLMLLFFCFFIEGKFYRSFVIGIFSGLSDKSERKKTYPSLWLPYWKESSE